MVREDAWSGYSYDINEHGDSVGQINLEDGGAVAALWRADGSLVELGVPDWLPYDYARAFAINDSGTVVGNASLFRLEEDGYYHEYNDPFVWTEADGLHSGCRTSATTGTTRSRTRSTTTATSSGSRTSATSSTR